MAELPVDDRELPFLSHVRSADCQALTVQAAISSPSPIAGVSPCA